jgi:hypothetical protein
VENRTSLAEILWLIALILIICLAVMALVGPLPR